jgi:hypothetical protein
MDDFESVMTQSKNMNGQIPEKNEILPQVGTIGSKMGTTDEEDFFSTCS